MARTRDIRPDFFKHEELAECSPLARLLFIGLWGLADREGRLQDRPKKLKAEILPYENCCVDTLLQELANSKDKFIIRYEVESKNYIWIPTFIKHQRIHPKEPESVIPAPEDIKGDIQNHGLPRLNHDLSAASCTKPSCTSSPSSPTRSPKPPEGESEGFQKFWSDYPKKTTRKDCVDHWRSHTLDTKLQEILNGLNGWKTTDQWTKENGKFIPDPIRFLRRERWKDELTVASNHNGSKPPSKADTVRQAYIDRKVLFHHLVGRRHPESLTPVDAAYNPVDISNAKSLRPDKGNAIDLQEWTINND